MIGRAPDPMDGCRRPFLLRVIAPGLLVLAAAGAPDGVAAAEPPPAGDDRPDPAVADTAASGNDLNLFQMVARADIIATVRVLDGSHRYAAVEVEESFKGTIEPTRLRIAFRDFNWSRRPGEDPIVFPEGQREILFLAPYTAAKRSEKNRDLYTLFRGRHGRVVLAAEGEDPMLEAIRHLVRIAALDPASQTIGLRELIGSRNQVLRSAGLRELARLRAVDPGLYGPLTAALSDPEPATRADAIGLIAILFGLATAGQDLLPEEQPGRIALARVIEIARNDRSARVRRSAVVAIAAWPSRPETEAELRNISIQDQDQTVRYEAQRALVSFQR